MSPSAPPLHALLLEAAPWPEAVGVAGPLSLLPVLLAIGLALWTRQVLVSLGAGLLMGAALLVGLRPHTAVLAVVDPLIIDTIADRGHVKVTIFSLFIAATVAVAGRAGATRALVDRVAARATTRRSGMVASWLAGMIVFFDDYANCLVVGAGMRPLTDRLRISREKLAFIVDSTAAPVATVALVSTWIGFEVGLISDALKAAGQPINAYSFFMEGLGYRFYPWLAIAMTGLVCWTGRDFGPMLEAERRALHRPATEVAAAPNEGARGSLWLAVVPIGAMVVVTAASIGLQGSAKAASGAAFFEIVGGADGYDAMLHGSIAGLLLVLGMTVASRALDLNGALHAALDGARELVEPLAVLFCAWGLSTVIGELKAADFVIGLLGDRVPGWSLPTLVFLIGAVISFATGTSFGTMGVLIPLAVPLAFQIDPSVAMVTTAAVLSGAVWGDHCSPISDTTILSATGSGCELGAHTRTQLPYALAGGLISVLLGTLPAGLGAPAWLLLPLGGLACAALLRIAGRRAEELGPLTG
jgi:Na+/H+ antiporter NhaC